MKTAVTVIKTIQTGYENFKDLKTTRVFDDDATLLEIKEWVKGALNLHKSPVSDVSLGSVEISDVE